VTLTADGKTAKDPTLVERWLEDQREWQRTAMSYLDSMVKNEDFLVHLGNAMRGSLLAGKPYPTAAPAAAQPAAQEAPADDRLDRVLFALHQIQGQLTDLRMALDDLSRNGKGSPSKMPAARPKAKAPKRPKRPAPAAARKARPGKSRSRG
jgi:hypothetical protein